MWNKSWPSNWKWRVKIDWWGPLRDERISVPRQVVFFFSRKTIKNGAHPDICMNQKWTRSRSVGIFGREMSTLFLVKRWTLMLCILIEQKKSQQTGEEFHVHVYCWFRRTCDFGKIVKNIPLAMKNGFRGFLYLF